MGAVQPTLQTAGWPYGSYQQPSTNHLPTPTRSQVYFQMIDSLLAAERLPPEYAGRMQQVGAGRRRLGTCVP